MILELPLSSDPAQSFSVQLGQVKYYIEAQYNSRNGVWTLDLFDDASRVAIVRGIALVLGVDMLAPYNLGIGTFIALDNTGQGLDAGQDDLGTRVAVYWLSPDETLT